MKPARGSLRWLGLALVAAACAIPAPAQERGRETPPNLSSFRLITERNIFNADRSGVRPQSTPRAPATTRVDSFTLVGTLSSDRGTFAFFDGSGSDYRKAVKAGGVIAGYRVSEITPASVKLAAKDQEVELKVGMHMRRENLGEWQLRARAESTPQLVRTDADTRWSSSRDSDWRTRRSSSDPGRGQSNDEIVPAPQDWEPGADAEAGSEESAEEVLKRLMQQREAENQ